MSDLTLPLPEKPQSVRDLTFQELVLDYPGFCLVEFYESWVSPCKAVRPAVLAVAHQLQGKLRVLFCDAEANPKTFDQFGLRTTPARLLFQSGTLLARWYDYQTEAVLLANLKAATVDPSTEQATPRRFR